MKNDSTRGGVKISIPPTLLVSVVGVMQDVTLATTLDAKRAGDRVYVLGRTRPELGGTEFLAQRVERGRAASWTTRRVPTVDLDRSRRCCEAVSAAIDRGLLRSVHALGPGGLALALARTAMGGNLGMLVDLGNVPLSRGEGVRSLAPSELLYSETGGRFLLTIAPGDRARFEAAMDGLPLRRLGEVTPPEDDGESRLRVLHPDEGVLIDEEVSVLRRAWKETLHGV